MKKEFDVEIRDGKLVITFGDMGGEHHKFAEEFLKEVESLMGTKPEVEARKGHHHHHHHGDQHEHHHQ